MEIKEVKRKDFVKDNLDSEDIDHDELFDGLESVSAD